MKISTQEAKQAIRCQEPFETYGALSGKFTRIGYHFGYLPPDWQPRWREAIEKAQRGLPLYVVYSYDTPIGWSQAGEVTIPDVRYSSTTSKHQSIVRVYLQ